MSWARPVVFAMNQDCQQKIENEAKEYFSSKQYYKGLMSMIKLLR